MHPELRLGALRGKEIEPLLAREALARELVIGRETGRVCRGGRRSVGSELLLEGESIKAGPKRPRRSRGGAEAEVNGGREGREDGTRRVARKRFHSASAAVALALARREPLLAAGSWGVSAKQQKNAKIRRRQDAGSWGVSCLGLGARPGRGARRQWIMRPVNNGWPQRQAAAWLRPAACRPPSTPRDPSSPAQSGPGGRSLRVGAEALGWQGGACDSVREAC
eukprot:CAMPEP_0179917920 /NCGR_PEP_ID=MMETSP0983-20121128/3107_1 /TAXON_ID=483367 /ORGANISM="non described non described, Strain CCMP 2436" /LENGTH=222 /DNA_ID=CAMNT_0021820721 /DNA_START=86 /DNA_END=754 /DNA_ORIENTATION=+